MLGKVAPEEVSLDGTVGVVVAKVWGKQVGVREGQGEAIGDAAETDRLHGRSVLRNRSDWGDWFSFIGDKVVVAGDRNLMRHDKTIWLSCWAQDTFVIEDRVHSGCDVVHCELCRIYLRVGACAELQDHVMREGVEEDSCLLGGCNGRLPQ